MKINLEKDENLEITYFGTKINLRGVGGHFQDKKLEVTIPEYSDATLHLREKKRFSGMRTFEIAYTRDGGYDRT